MILYTSGLILGLTLGIIVTIWWMECLTRPAVELE